MKVKKKEKKWGVISKPNSILSVIVCLIWQISKKKCEKRREAPNQQKTSFCGLF